MTSNKPINLFQQQQGSGKGKSGRDASGSSRLGGAANGNLVEFKAGRMFPKKQSGDASSSAKSTIESSKVKGKIWLDIDNSMGGLEGAPGLGDASESALVHFHWAPRNASPGSSGDEMQESQDLLLFPGDAKFERVQSSLLKNPDRELVYCLNFESSNQKFFYWIQEPWLLQKQVKLADGKESSKSAIQNFDPEMVEKFEKEHVQPMRNLLEKGASAASRAASNGGNAQPSEQQLLQQLLQAQGINLPQSTPSADTAEQQQTAMETETSETALGDLMLNWELVGPVIKNPEMRQQLFPQLPEEIVQAMLDAEANSGQGAASVEQVFQQQVLNSQSFRQAIREIEATLSSGSQPNQTLLQQLGLFDRNADPSSYPQISSVTELLRFLKERKSPDSNSASGAKKQ